MSVYTTVEVHELETFLREYELGTLVGYQGIGEGVENTNYFVTTTTGQYVLTLFESIGFNDLPYYLDLMAFLAEHGVPSAHPLADCQGDYLRTLKGKPAALVQRLAGASVPEPNLPQCRALGAALGHLHVEGQAFAGQRDHTRGPRWRRKMAEQLLPYLNAEDAALLKDELRFQSRYSRSGLPWGVIHADLFRDNALFSGDQLTGIIDFYYACNSVLLYDLAVTVNDWCFRNHALDTDRVFAILSAYHTRRPLQAGERTIWPAMLRVAALRFWLSRLQTQLFPRPGALTQIKDPNEFKHILCVHVDNYAALRDLWI
jgi:homoserine kinase type II